MWLLLLSSPSWSSIPASGKVSEIPYWLKPAELCRVWPPPCFSLEWAEVTFVQTCLVSGSAEVEPKASLHVRYPFYQLSCIPNPLDGLEELGSPLMELKLNSIGRSRALTVCSFLCCFKFVPTVLPCLTYVPTLTWCCYMTPHIPALYLCAVFQTSKGLPRLIST